MTWTRAGSPRPVPGCWPSTWSTPGRAARRWQAAGSGGPARRTAFEADVAARLAALGITVVPQYGVGGYRVDFAAAHPDDPSRMILAVEADGAAYRDSGSVRDRDRLRKEHLERLGWRVHRLWSTSWFTDPERRAGQAPRRLPASRPRQSPGPAPPPPPDDSVADAAPRATPRRPRPIPKPRLSPDIPPGTESHDIPSTPDRSPAKGNHQPGPQPTAHALPAAGPVTARALPSAER